MAGFVKGKFSYGPDHAGMLTFTFCEAERSPSPTSPVKREATTKSTDWLRQNQGICCGKIRVEAAAKLHFRQKDIDLAAGKGYEIRFLRLAPGPCGNDGKPGGSRADGKLAVPLIDKPPDSGEAVSPALVLVARRAVKQRLVDGVEITAKFEPCLTGIFGTRCPRP